MRVNAIDLRNIIESETGLKFNRGNKISCPFHTDKTPSLSIDKKRNKWKCFSCGCGGDAIDFVSELKGLSYAEACKYLGVELNEEHKSFIADEEKLKGYIKWQIDNWENFKGWKLIKIYKFVDKNNKTLYFTAKFSTPGKKEIKY